MSVIGLLTGTNPHLYELKVVRKGLNESGYFEGQLGHHLSFSG
jgi:hypothetical protein